MHINFKIFTYNYFSSLTAIIFCMTILNCESILMFQYSVYWLCKSLEEEKKRKLIIKQYPEKYSFVLLLAFNKYLLFFAYFKDGFCPNETCPMVTFMVIYLINQYFRWIESINTNWRLEKFLNLGIKLFTSK